LAKVGCFGRGVLVGREICKYMGLKYHSRMITMLYRKGMPMDKDSRGRWRTTAGLIEKWIYERGIMMRRLEKMEKYVVSGNGRGGYSKHACRLESYRPEDRAEAMREIKRERVRWVVENG